MKRFFASGYPARVLALLRPTTIAALASIVPGGCAASPGDESGEAKLGTNGDDDAETATSGESGTSEAEGASEEGSAAETGADPFEPTWDNVYDTLQFWCGCHDEQSHESGFSGIGSQAVTYSRLVNTLATQADMPRVTPGEPATSYLLHKLKGTHIAAGGSGKQMPGGTLCCLDAQTMSMIESWVAQGALEQ